MKLTLAVMICLSSLAAVAFGAPAGPTPEIDPGSATNAIAVITGAALIARNRLKR